MVETEIYCHGCDKYFRFDLDVTKNGNHVIKCPGCGHEHCRVIKNGRITSTCWDQRNGITVYYTAASTGTYSTGIYVGGGSSTTSASDNYPGAWTEWRSI